MNRREVLKAVLIVLSSTRVNATRGIPYRTRPPSLARRSDRSFAEASLTDPPFPNAARASVSTLIGTGSPGHSDQEVNNPYGLVIGPDRALYFCDLDNQRIRRLDLNTHRTTTIAGNGQKAYSGDGGQAVAASLNMPH